MHLCAESRRNQCRNVKIRAYPYIANWAAEEKSRLMFRDFIYLDIDRTQSIIAQLRQGLLDQIMEGKLSEDSKRLGATANFLTMLIPFSASASVERKNATDIQASKVLHDYAFNLALSSLEEEGLLLVADDLDPYTSSIPEAAFVLVKGSAKIFDYSTFDNLATHEKDLDKLFSSEQPSGNREQRRQQGKKKSNSSALGELKTVVDAFFKDAIQITVTNNQGFSFIGPVTRQYLREEIHNLIFKYGSKPQGEWGMLAQVTRISSLPGEARQQLSVAINESENPFEEMQTASSALNKVLDVMNSLQELMGSAAYPDVAVSPIAVYRELRSL